MLQVAIAVILPGATRLLACGHLSHAERVTNYHALLKIHITLLQTPRPICPKYHFSHLNSISYNLYTKRGKSSSSSDLGNH